VYAALFRQRRQRRELSSRSRRAATARSERLWDNGVIPYDIDANFSGIQQRSFIIFVFTPPLERVAINSSEILTTDVLVRQKTPNH